MTTSLNLFKQTRKKGSANSFQKPNKSIRFGVGVQIETVDATINN